MSKSLLFILCLFILIAGCNQDNSKEQELEERLKKLEEREKKVAEKEKAVIETPKPITYSPEPASISKFVYVVFKVEEPVLHHTERHSYSNLENTKTTIVPEANMVFPEENVYLSEIKEVSGFDEDKQYEYMDEIEGVIRKKLGIVDMNFRNKVMVTVSDPEERDRLSRQESKILDRKLKAFDTYKEASISRNNNKGQF